jgi:hypothetical protein
MGNLFFIVTSLLSLWIAATRGQHFPQANIPSLTPYYDSLGNRIDVDWRHIGLTVKDQETTQSCISQAISTVLEAYFKRSPEYSYLFQQGQNIEWSGYDIYYCKLNQFTRRMFRLALQSLKNKRIASARCPHVQRMMFKQAASCANRRECQDFSAVIEEYGGISNTTTLNILQALHRHGPLGILHTWGKEIISYSEYIQHYQHTRHPVFYKQDWAADAANIKVDLVTKLVNWHATVLVGYGYRPDGRLFWIIQNSHGTHTGYYGYLYVGEHELNFMDYDVWYISKARFDNPLAFSKFL